MHTPQWIAFGLCGLLWLPQAAAQLHHDLDVSLQPGSGSIEVLDTITLEDDRPASLTFALHPALTPRLQSGNARLVELPQGTDDHDSETPRPPGSAARRYRLDLARGENRFTLRYGGRITDDPQGLDDVHTKSAGETGDIISPQGVLLSGASAWYPRIDGGMITFDLKVHLPAGWKSMSQGELLALPPDADSTPAEHWHAVNPQEEIYLIAGPFNTWSGIDRGVTAMVLLREPDAPLARKYLAATHRYLALYDELIGPYPYKKFAMVENFRQTGYGMPSFTLLGSRVIRFPFILSSSYPHEILHNWWGNSVYVDYDSGNWSEGLTSYLADHLIREQHGEGSAYRRDILQKYTDHVGRQGDFPLTDFRSRHSARTEAVGYGKSLMLFHMLRRKLGDAVFRKGLQDFYRQYRFRIAGFDNVRDSLAKTSGEPLDKFFQQWVERTGAPQLDISQALAVPEDDHFRLTAIIEQTQAGPAYELQVPVAVNMEGVDVAYQTDVVMDDRRRAISLALPARPVQLRIDPEFDVFRRLHRDEIPPAVSQAMGAEQVLIVLADREPPALKQTYSDLARRWQQELPGQVNIVSDMELQALPADRAVWLFGWHNRFRPQFNTAMEAYDFSAHGDRVRIAGTLLTADTHSLVVLGRQPDSPDQALGWLAAASAAALPGLGRKLPHYGRYSYLGFSGEEPGNILKGQWPVLNSSMSIRIAQGDGAAVTFSPASLAPRRALIEPAADPSPP